MLGFWFFMLIMNLLIPFTMIGSGRYFVKNAGPKEINMLSGYRTSMSMKNQDTWRFAHTYCGKLWRIIGKILLPISITAMLFVLGKEINTIGAFGGILCGIQCFFLAMPIILTEISLKNNFDENGKRRN